MDVGSPGGTDTAGGMAGPALFAFSLGVSGTRHTVSRKDLEEYLDLTIDNVMGCVYFFVSGDQ